MSSLERFTISSSRQPDRQITVYRPDAGTETARPLPLLVLHDGQNLFDADRCHVPGQTWRVAETADELIASGAIPPLVIVGIDHAGDARVREFTPTRGGRGGGGAVEYRRFVMEDVVPFVAREFDATHADITMGGSSLGALATLAIATQFPARVKQLLVMSPSVWWDRRVILRRLRRTALDRPRVWLDIGLDEGPRAIADVRALREVLEGQTSALHYVEDPDGTHSETAWARRLPDALTWVYTRRGLAPLP